MNPEFDPAKEDELKRSTPNVERPTPKYRLVAYAVRAARSSLGVERWTLGVSPLPSECQMLRHLRRPTLPDQWFLDEYQRLLSEAGISFDERDLQ